MKRQVPWGVWASLFPLGLGAWAPVIPGLRLRRRLWTAPAPLWSAIEVVGWIGAQAAGPVDAVVDLDGGAVERLREHTVFLPR